MTSKIKFFSWSKNRQPTPEPYHRTGGLVDIDSGDSGKEAYLAHDVKNDFKSGRPRPPYLNLTIPSEYNEHQISLSPASARHNAALVNSASNLLAVVNDMLRSPAQSATWSKSAELHKPLPSRPRSVSLPASPVLPAELPGSILLENQGFPSIPEANAGPATPSTSTMKSALSGGSHSPNAIPKPSLSRVSSHKKSLSEASLQRRSKSRPNLITSPSHESTDSKLTTCSVSTTGGNTSSTDSTKARVGRQSMLQPSSVILESQSRRKSVSANRGDEVETPGTPTPTSSRSKQIDELKATITAQDNTISTLQAQFGNLRTNHEAHIESLTKTHSAEVTSLKEFTRVLEEQLAHRPLHHASSNHLLLFCDTSDQPLSPGAPSLLSPQTAAGSTPANSIRSFNAAVEQPAQSPQPRDSSEMENLKRKLSVTRRAENGNLEMARELNQYKQNNVALQKQIESLMAKLSQSKQNEKKLSTTLVEIEKNCNEWQEKARQAERLEKSGQALQNTIDHLEYRLEIANCDKLDAEEQLFNLQSQRSPFDPPKLHLPGPSTFANGRQSTRTSMSTIFEAQSPQEVELQVTLDVMPEEEEETNRPSRNSSTLAAFISQIEQLQERVQERDVRISELEQETERLRLVYEQVEHENKELNVQTGIQDQQLRKAKKNEAHIEQLRTAIIDREAIIGEREKALRIAEQQLEHHKLLLHKEVRRHATVSILAKAQDDDPLPELTTLASKEDIDRWIARLRFRLKKEKEKAKGSEKDPPEGLVAQLVDLKHEVDFYVREIIYYKLDIKGYKSDIRKLKQLTGKMGGWGGRSDVSSPTPSIPRSVDTPIKTRYPSGISGLGISSTPSPVSTGPISASVSVGRPITPLPADLLTPGPSPAETYTPTFAAQKKGVASRPLTPQTPLRLEGVNPANEADNINPGISPRSVARLSPERRKPTPPSPNQEKFGELATNFPLSTPASPRRHETQRSMSDSIIRMYATPRIPERAPASNQNQTVVADDNHIVSEARQRSASVTGPAKGKTTPERPPRPLYGLYEGRDDELSKPPRVDVMAEAMRNSPDHVLQEARQPIERKVSASLASAVRGFSNNQLSRSGSSSSAIPAPLSLRPRAGSATSSTAAVPGASSPQHKLSSASASTIPFIIAMPSPHNPALITPTTAVQPTTCSITGKSATTAPLKVQSPMSRTGVGGTMASSTPLTSPVEPTGASKPNPFGGALPVAKGSPSRAGSTSHGRSASLNSMAIPGRKNENGMGARGHTRNASAGSIRSAMQLPSSLIKGKGKTRKDIISPPTPLASPFTIDRSSAGNSIGRAL